MGKRDDKDNKTALDLINLIKDLVTDELNKRDNTCVCQVVACNEDGTYNIFVVPDTRTVITNVKSMSLEVIKIGDYVYVYKFQNKLNNAIILARAGTNAADIRFVTVENFNSTITTRSSGGGGTVTSVSAGTGLSISGTATVNPTVNIATGYSLISDGPQTFSGSKGFNGHVSFNDGATLTNKPLLINSDNTPSYTGDDWDASFYADKIEIVNADNGDSWTLQFPQALNGETKTLATTDDIPTKALVWTNSSPTSDFAAQTITVSSLANYSYIVVLFKLAKSNDNYLYFKMPRKTNYWGPFSMSDGVNTYFRNMKVVSNTRLQFLAATYNGSAANNAMIPIEIWGTNGL